MCPTCTSLKVYCRTHDTIRDLNVITMFYLTICLQRTEEKSFLYGGDHLSPHRILTSSDFFASFIDSLTSTDRAAESGEAISERVADFQA